MRTRDLSKPESYVDIDSVLTMLRLRIQIHRSYASMISNGLTPNDPISSKYDHHVGAVDALTDAINWIEEYTA